MSLASIEMPRRARLRAFFDAIRSENFEKKFRGRKIFGPKPRAIAPKSPLPDDAWEAVGATMQQTVPKQI